MCAVRTSANFDLNSIVTVGEKSWRWAQIVPPMILRDLMRHRSVETTEKYYVGINAKRTAEILREYTRKAISERAAET
jgi:hypothetical protein